MKRSRVSLASDQDDAAWALSCALRALNEDLSLWRDDLLSDEDFDVTLAEAIASYRTWLHDRVHDERRSKADSSGANLGSAPASISLVDSQDAKSSQQWQSPAPSCSATMVQTDQESINQPPEPRLEWLTWPPVRYIAHDSRSDYDEEA
ncbi:MAG TPA: hypothetical protein VNU24_06250 [Solirubrobacteraceae bacterium]|nr:hypothetical protein [Solirubrobacteraceae bacterium]